MLDLGSFKEIFKVLYIDNLTLYRMMTQLSMEKKLEVHMSEKNWTMTIKVAPEFYRSLDTPKNKAAIRLAITKGCGHLMSVEVESLIK